MFEKFKEKRKKERAKIEACKKLYAVVNGLEYYNDSYLTETTINVDNLTGELYQLLNAINDARDEGMKVNVIGWDEQSTRALELLTEAINELEIKTNKTM